MPANEPLTEQQAAARRSSVRRTVLVFAVIAIAIYAGFILLGAMTGGAPR